MSVSESTATELVQEIFRLQRTLKHVGTPMTRDSRIGQIGLAHAGILFMLSGSCQRRATDLAEELGITTSALSRQIAFLTDRGLLHREPDPDDGRASLLSVTDDGMALIDSVMRERSSRLIGLLSGWNETEARDASAMLGRLNEVFQNAAHSEHPNYADHSDRSNHSEDTAQAPSEAHE